jgi:hypothetical protein
MNLKLIYLYFHKFNPKILLLTSVFFLSFLIRLPYLGYESINPDAVNWHYRCQQFTNGIKFMQFEKTYPHYHPGVTLCYVMLFPTEIYKQITNTIYDNSTYMDFNFYNTLLLVVVISLLIAYTSFLIGGWPGAIFAFLLNVEPFFYGNSRLIHLDVLVSLFLFIGLLHLFKYIKSQNYIDLGLVSLFFVLGFLTKSVSIVFIFLGVFAVWWFSKNFRYRASLLYVVASLFFLILLFPAMWVAPVETLKRILSEAERVGVRTGHSQYFLGNLYTLDEDINASFYIVNLFVKFSPVIWLTLIIILISIFVTLKKDWTPFKLGKSIWIKFLEFVSKHKESIILLVFYGIYFALISYSSKKLDRYLLVLIPPIIYFISLQTVSFVRLTFIFLGMVNVISLIYFMPYLFLYYSPIFNNYGVVNQIIGQKSFGQGIYDLKNFLIESYGETNLGFYDIKPMSTIYPNSKIYDIRETNPRKVDLVILSINETLPEDYKDDFVFKESFYLIDIPLYQIYVKKN